jgi:hypothetical protein
MSAQSSVNRIDASAAVPSEIHLPAPTAWPFVLGLGFVLLFAGLLTSASISILGAFLSVAACVGWFREVLPREHEEVVPVVPREIPIRTERPRVERFPTAPEPVRAWLPLETYPISAGIKGGWAGSVAMAVLACTFGLIKTGSIWYPINLLGAIVFEEPFRLDPAQLNAFHGNTFLVALIFHATGSTLVGLLYGAMLPMFPRRPILLGGVIAPLLWSGLLSSLLGLLNPLLESLINWYWFAASQIGFGVVAGLIVMRQHRIPTKENIPFAFRAGIEAPGLMHKKDGGEKQL